MSLMRTLMRRLFGDAFTPKKAPSRKSACLSSLYTVDPWTRELELGFEYGPPRMNIGGHIVKFKEGQWIAESGGNTSRREIHQLEKRNVRLEVENHRLKLEIEILLDMLTETTIEEKMEKEGKT